MAWRCAVFRRCFWTLPLVVPMLVVAGCECGRWDDSLDAALPDAFVPDAPSCTEHDDCDDGLACNGEERCIAGSCARGMPMRCDDGLACTTDFCSEELRRCVNRPIDVDRDGYPDRACVDARGTPLGTDCDDARANVHPGALELCDAEGLDEDCNPMTLGGRDFDGDGFIDAACCNGARCGDDCNDAVRSANPMGTEVCNLIDDDCDGRVDEGVQVTVYRDADGDGYGDASMSRMACPSLGGWVTNDDDCDDANRMRSPALPEVCDGIDNDCDGVADPTDSTETATWYRDADGDGFGDASITADSCAPLPGHSLLGTDCDDAAAAVNPAQAERCNGRDDDCNGVADFVIAPNDLEDDDGDGVADAACMPRPSPADCDDRDPTTSAGAPEVCDGRDNDCDGMVDEGVSRTPFYRDLDGDGWGSAHSGVVLGCGAVVGHVVRDGDCDDADPMRNPGSVEACNGRDEDCDGRVDEASAGPLCAMGSSCLAGRCRAEIECPPGTADCDGIRTNGCEVMLASDPAHCGRCGNVCSAAEPHTVPICALGSCGLACEGGWDDCNGNLRSGLDGCEARLGTDAHCARCMDACGPTEMCDPSMRRCVARSCTAPLADCDMNGSCETDTSTTLAHCGSCGRVCSGMNATWSCSSGSCRVASCVGGFSNCDGRDDNGCESMRPCSALSVSPDSWDFGTAVAHTSGGRRTFTVQNVGVLSSGMVTASLGGSASTSFAIFMNSCGPSLTAGASCTVEVEHRPMVLGSHAASLNVMAESGATAAASLSGTGTVRLTPRIHDFGSVMLATTSMPVSFVVENPTSASAGSMMLHLAGPDDGDFGILTNPCHRSVLGPAARCSFDVFFRPTATGMRSAEVEVILPVEGGGPVRATVSGTGTTPWLRFDPPTHDFGSVLVVGGSTSITVTLRNDGTAMTGDVTFNLTGSHVMDFYYDAGACMGSPLASGGNCPFSVGFDPTATGMRTAILTATASPGGTATLLLTGTGTGGL